MKPFIKESEFEYAAKRATHMTFHQLKEFAHNPRLFAGRRDGTYPTPEPTHAMAFGSALHCYVLEGADEFHERFVVGGPINPKTGHEYGTDTKAYREWSDEQTKTAISTADFATVVQMHEAWERSDARHLAVPMDGSEIVEGVLRIFGSPENGYPGNWQMRIDYFSHDSGLWDLKTTRTIADFEASIRRHNYVHQLAFYRRALKLHGIDPVDVGIVAIEAQAPYRLAVIDISRGALDAAEAEVESWIEAYSRCARENEWPAFLAGTESFMLSEEGRLVPQKGERE